MEIESSENSAMPGYFKKKGDEVHSGERKNVKR